MKIAFLTIDGNGTSIAYHLQEEGNEVYLGQVRDWSSIKLKSTESDKEKRARLSIYDGLFKNKWPAEKLMSFLLGQPRNRRQDWIVICDFNFLWPYADRLRAAGYRGLLPHKEDHDLEQDRNLAHEVIEELYPDVGLADYHEFKSAKDGIKFLEETDNGKLYVLKGFHMEAETIVSTGDDVDDNRELIIDALERDRDHLYEKDGFILEEEIEDALEFTPEAVSWNGEVRCMSVDVEHKRLGSRSGPMTGCTMGAVLWQDDNEEMYERFLKPLEKRMMRPNEITFWDLSIYYSPKRKKFYAGEFCPNRMGYDAVFGEICTFRSSTDWLTYLISGEYEERDPVSASIRVFNLDKKEKLFIGDPANRNVWCFDIHKENDKLYTAGSGKEAYTLTSSSEDLETAINQLYEFERTIEFEPGYFLEKHDWHDTEYHENILHRIEVLTQLGVIEYAKKSSREDRIKATGDATFNAFHGQYLGAGETVS